MSNIADSSCSYQSVSVLHVLDFSTYLIDVIVHDAYLKHLHLEGLQPSLRGTHNSYPFAIPNRSLRITKVTNRSHHMHLSLHAGWDWLSNQNPALRSQHYSYP